MAAIDRQMAKVVMLVNNDCRYDSRVMKTAESVAASGREVTVVCRASADTPRFEAKNNVTYRRVLEKKVSSAYVAEALSLWLSHRPLFIRGSIGGAIFVAIATWKFCTRLLSFIRQLCSIPVSTLRSWIYWLVRAKSSLLHIVVSALLKNTIVRGRAFEASAKSVISRALRSIARFFYFSLENREVELAMREAVANLGPDIIHAHDLGTLSAGATFAKQFNARLIYDSHELEMHRNATFSKKQQKRRQREERHGVKAADAVITVSDSIAAHLASHYTIPKPTITFKAPELRYGGTPKVVLRGIRSDIGINNNVPLYVYVGGVTINRGLENLLRALTYCPQAYFATVGPSNQRVKNSLEALVAELGLSERVFFLEPVPSQHVVPYVADADVSVLPIQNVCLSYRYCMPNKLFESVFARLPVAVSNLPDMAAFVTKWSCGEVFDQTSPLDIADTLKKIYEDKFHYVLSDDQRTSLYEQYSWEAQERKLHRLYDSLSW